MTSSEKNTTRRKKATAVIDPTLCTGCEVCVTVCPSNCITIIESDLNFNGIATVNQEICNGCSFCAIDCPWETISIVNADGSLFDYEKTLVKLRGYK
jgi:Pyruvate/2-oxoacid:ferredoxin oxidoreductase delta subunit